MANKQVFGRRLLSLRQERGINQEQLGKAIGVSKSGISSFEKGKSMPSPENLKALADYFDVSVDYLLTTDANENALLELGRRFASTRENAGLSIREAVARSGVNQQTLSVVESGRVWPKLSTVTALAQAYQVDPSVLLGVSQSPENLARIGLPLKREEYENIFTPAWGHELAEENRRLRQEADELRQLVRKLTGTIEQNSPSTLPAQQPDEPRVVVPDQAANKAAIIFNVKAAANYLSGYDSQEPVEQVDVLTMPRFMLKGQHHAVFPVIGDSMEPTFLAKDYVVCRFIEPQSWTSIKDFDVCVIVSKTHGVQLKRLKVRPDEHLIRCMSDNRRHRRFNLDFSEVVEIWRFEWRITASAENITEDLFKKVDALEDNVEDLRGALESIMASANIMRVSAGNKEDE